MWRGGRGMPYSPTCRKVKKPVTQEHACLEGSKVSPLRFHSTDQPSSQRRPCIPAEGRHPPIFTWSLLAIPSSLTSFPAQ